jgi:hypothetical protein
MTSSSTQKIFFDAVIFNEFHSRLSRHFLTAARAISLLLTNIVFTRTLPVRCNSDTLLQYLTKVILFIIKASSSARDDFQDHTQAVWTAQYLQGQFPPRNGFDRPPPFSESRQSLANGQSPSKSSAFTVFCWRINFLSAADSSRIQTCVKLAERNRQPSFAYNPLFLICLLCSPRPTVINIY